jgi:hypothetical protein
MTDYDHWKTTDPSDNSIEELVHEQALADAWDEFLGEGDPVEMLEAYISEDQGEAQALVRAYRVDNQADLTRAAYNMAIKLDAIAEALIDAD